MTSSATVHAGPSSGASTPRPLGMSSPASQSNNTSRRSSLFSGGLQRHSWTPSRSGTTSGTNTVPSSAVCSDDEDNGGTSGPSPAKINSKPLLEPILAPHGAQQLDLVMPDAYFFAFFLLVLLLLSSPLIKILSVALFVLIVVLDDS